MWEFLDVGRAHRFKSNLSGFEEIGIQSLFYPFLFSHAWCRKQKTALGIARIKLRSDSVKRAGIAAPLLKV